MTSEQLRSAAVDAIVRYLEREEAEALAIVDQMTIDEVDDLLEHDGYETGAVAMAAIIYRMRLRTAKDEAKQHHETICRRIPSVAMRTIDQ